MSIKKSSGGVTSSAIKRLQNDFILLKKEPVPHVTAQPLHSNILEWRYVITGPPDTPYEGGYYHGKLIFPKDFPFKPPSIYIITPNGRFRTNYRLCLSISDYHPDTWNPAWSVATILTGLLSFMVETSPTHGSIDSPEATKRGLAYDSLEFNLKDRIFCETFPEIKQEIEQKLLQRRLLSGSSSVNRSNPASNTLNDDASTGNVHVGHQNGRYLFLSSGFLTNILVGLGFAFFAYTVRWVIQRTLQDESL